MAKSCSSAQSAENPRMHSVVKALERSNQTVSKFDDVLIGVASNKLRIIKHKKCHFNFNQLYRPMTFY